MATVSAYVHFPWCLQKCPYCDFASGAIRRDQIPHRAYADAVLRELELRAPSLADATLGSVFFGGGTPSLWAPAEVGRVVSAIRAAFAGEPPALEVTLECNPTSLDEARAVELRDAGVTRLSIGVQSLRDDALRFLGRLHDADGALSALAAARRAGVRVSADIMFGTPGLSAEDLCAQLDAVLDTGVEHVSAYALTIEPDTQFGALHAKGKLALAPEESFARAYLAAEDRLAERGFEHYEVSNYALPGAACAHNLHTWRGGAYLGLGAGAVGCLHGAPGHARRYRNAPRPEAYQQASGPAELESSSEQLGPDEIVREHLMLGLRTDEGMSLSAAAARAGVDPLAGRERAVQRQLERGNLMRAGERLRVPRERWLHLDGIVSDLF